MQLRIIAGKYGGRLIKTPNGSTTHPMSERARNAIFNSLGNTILDKKILDCFAGSGAIGLEALSRGAKEAYFIENDRIANRVIEKNLKDLDILDNVKQLKFAVGTFLDKFDDSFDIIFADPPYNKVSVEAIKRLSLFLNKDGYLILSLPKEFINIEIPGVSLISFKKYSEANILIYKKLS